MSLHVQGHVVRASEDPGAHGTMKRFGACVFTRVASQLVRAGETPTAAFEGTPKWLLTYVDQEHK